jgi:cell division ATPase FtsA
MPAMPFELFGAGMHLTGGGSLWPGAVDLARECFGGFGLPMQIGHVKGVLGDATVLENPRNACAIGLVKAPFGDCFPFAM